jgi:Mg2+ and Co2+ transporter CorA
MNFQFMQELAWRMEYLFALLTVGLPLWYFWHKGWLK